MRNFDIYLQHTFLPIPGLSRYFQLFICLMIMIGLPLNSKSQEFEWVKSTPLDFQNNFFTLRPAVAAGPDNDAVWAAMSEYKESYGLNTFGNIALVHFSEEGNMIANSELTGKAEIGGIKLDSQGNIILSVHIRETTFLESGDSINYSGDGIDNYLVKLDAGFNLIWAMDLTETYAYSSVLCVATDTEDNIFAGYSYQYGTKISQFSPEGDLIQEVEQEHVNLVSSLSVDAEGNIYVSGSCASYNATFGGVEFPTDLTYNFYIAKYSPQMEAQWVNYAEDITCTYPEVVCHDPDHIYFAGNISTETTLGSITLNGPSWVYDFYVARLNADGEFLWAKEIPPENTLGDASIGELQFLDTDDENNVYLAGFLRGEIDWGNGIVSSGFGYTYDILTTKFNSEGEIVWAGSAGGEVYDRGVSVAACPDGSYYLAGTAWDESTFGDLSVTEEGVFPFLAKVSNGGSTTGFADNVDQGSPSFYPNPVESKLYLSARQVENIAEIKIFNQMGEEVNLPINPDYTEIDVNSLATGIYLVHIQMKDGTSSINKFLKR